jgi:putative peptide zinc metalloprotease protein
MIEEKHIYKLSSDIEFSKFNENEYLLHNAKLNKYTKLNQKYHDLLILADGSRTSHKLMLIFKKAISYLFQTHKL